MTGAIIITANAILKDSVGTLDSAPPEIPSFEVKAAALLPRL